MQILESIPVLWGVIVFLLMLMIYLFVSLSSIKSRQQNMMRGATAASLEDIITKNVEDIARIKENITQIENDIAEINARLQKAFAKFGTMRFSAFDNVGGDQSFALAILDADDNGIVMSSLKGRDGATVYLKTVENGNADIPLMKEEITVLKDAMRGR
ncbi:MAG: DUF4446 family protein [Selenomonadaceae bacterium]|nr:DUF4446 family protein [Selenomonadaceae bacterium]